jgi:hypothetical protein
VLLLAVLGAYVLGALAIAAAAVGYDARRRSPLVADATHDEVDDVAGAAGEDRRVGVGPAPAHR